MAAKSVAIEISPLPSPEPDGDNGGDGGGVVIAEAANAETADFVSETEASFPILPDSGVGGVSWFAILSSSLPLGLAARVDLRGSSVGVDMASKMARGGNEEGGRGMKGQIIIIEYYYFLDSIKMEG